MTNQEILEALKPLIVQVMGVRPENIRPESVLVADLGAESIDLLDLTFLIEEKFQVRIEANEIEREAKGRLADGVWVQSGVVYAAGACIELPVVPVPPLPESSD